MAAETAGFTIMFREALEAALLISIISTYLVKIGKRDQIKYLLYGREFTLSSSFGKRNAVLEY